MYNFSEKGQKKKKKKAKIVKKGQKRKMWAKMYKI